MRISTLRGLQYLLYPSASMCGVHAFPGTMHALSPVQWPMSMFFREGATNGMYGYTVICLCYAVCLALSAGAVRVELWLRVGGGARCRLYPRQVSYGTLPEWLRTEPLASTIIGSTLTLHFDCPAEQTRHNVAQCSVSRIRARLLFILNVPRLT